MISTMHYNIKCVLTINISGVLSLPSALFSLAQKLTLPLYLHLGDLVILVDA